MRYTKMMAKSQYDAPAGWVTRMHNLGYKCLTSATGAFGATDNIIMRYDGVSIVFKTRDKQPLSLRCCDFDEQQMKIINDLVQLGVLYR